VEGTTLVAGSLAVAREVFVAGDVTAPPDADVVVVPTAAAFTGTAQAAVAVADAFGDVDARIEALMVGDRASAFEPYFADRVAEADVVVLCDGSALHARSVWRDTPVGEAIHRAGLVVAIGSVASVLGVVMIDPRGGAPTTGLGYRTGVVLSVPAPAAQLARTRGLLGATETLVVVGPRGAVLGEDGRWRVVRGDVVVTRGDEGAGL
jgi:cyanophycinase-like exopeptidase